MPTISVIVPVYNVEPYLRRCVDSVLAQTFTDFELILVDDGSPDNCGAICDEYAHKDSRVHVIHQENRGLSAARNAGIDWVFANSDSQWISFVDSDDWVHVRYLEILLQTAEQHTVKICMCPLMRVIETIADTKVEKYKVELLQPNDAYVYKDNGVVAYACGRLYARKCFDSVRFPVGKLWEDVFTTHKLIFACDRIARIEVPLYYYYKNEAGICTQAWSPRHLDEIQAYLQLAKYFHSNHMNSMQDIACETCLEVISRQFDMIRYSEYLPREKKHYLSKVRRYARTAIICYKKGKISNLWHYEIAFPHLMKCYWIFKSRVDRWFYQ